MSPQGATPHSPHGGPYGATGYIGATGPTGATGATGPSAPLFISGASYPGQGRTYGATPGMRQTSIDNAIDLVARTIELFFEGWDGKAIPNWHMLADACVTASLTTNEIITVDKAASQNNVATQKLVDKLVEENTQIQAANDRFAHEAGERDFIILDRDTWKKRALAAEKELERVQGEAARKDHG